MGLAFTIAVANLVYWWTASATPTGLAFLPMSPITAIGFLILAATFAARLAFRLSRWPRVALVPLSGVAAIATMVAVLFHALPGFPDWESAFDPVQLTFLGMRIGASSYAAAILVAATAFNLCAMMLAAPASRWWKAGMVGAGSCALLGFLTLVADTAGNPIFAGAGLLGVAPPAALVFLLLNAGLALTSEVAQQLRSWLLGSAAAETVPPSLRDGRLAWQGFGVLACVALIGVSYLRMQTRAQREQVAEALKADAGLKAAQITKWRQEREGDAVTIWSAPWYREVTSTLVSAGLTPKQRAEMEEVTTTFLRVYHYRRLTIFDAAMRPLEAHPDEPDLTPAALQLALQPGFAGRLRETPAYLDRSGTLLWGHVVRIRRRYSEETGAYALIQKELRELFPYLQAWPEDNITGQTLLWQRQGNAVFVLGGLRDTPDAPAAFRQPFAVSRQLDQPGVTIARIARGETEPFEGSDQRGLPLLVAGQRIPDSDWLVMSSIRSWEVYAPLRRTSWMVVGFSSVVLGLVGFVTTRFWRDQQGQLINERLLADLDRKRTAARLGMIMQEATDIILVVDHELRVIDANRQAIQAFGWTREELLARRVQDLRAAETHANLPDIANRARTPEGAFFESIYRRRDGSTFPAEASVKQVWVDGQPQSLAILRDISDRKRAEAELRASEERYRLIAENTSDIIWLFDIAAGGFTYVSAAALPMLGFQPDELLGEGLTATLAGDSEDKARQLFRQLFEEVQSEGKPRHVVVELEQRHKAGRIIPTEVTASLLPGPGGPQHILGITRDITERRRAQETLQRFSSDLEKQVELRTAELAREIEVRRRAEERSQADQKLLRTLVDNIQTAVYMKDRSGRYLLINPHFERTAGLGAEAILGKTDRDVMPPAIAAALMEQDRKVMESGCASTSEETVPYADGALHHYVSTKVPLLDEQGAVYGMCGISSDITERKNMERNILANLDREKQLSEMKSQFISVASHEFRTPLAAAVGSLELLERHAAKLTETKRAELIGRIQRSLGRLTAIMNDVLNLSRADSGRVKVTRMNADLVRLAHDIVREVETGDRQQHRFVFEPTGGPETVPVDTKLTNHILSNLVGNAVRYSPAGTTVTIKLHIDATAFTFTVADEGIGVPAAERERIFEPFVRGSNVGQISGTGLGLNIVKRYTELMGGRIELLPSARGALFRVVVPLHQPAS